jgi:hypothetical protein
VARPRRPGAARLAWVLLALAALAVGGAAHAAPALSPALGLMAQQAADAYDHGRYTEAADLYTRFIAAGGEGAEARYDLGNCYLKAGMLGRAILEYRRSLKLEPAMDQAQHNLAVARRLLPARVAPWQPPPWEAAMRAVPEFWLDWAVIVPVLVGNVALALVLLLPPGLPRRTCAGILVAAFIGAGAAGVCWAYARTVLPSHEPAVVLKAATVYPNPDGTGAAIAVLPQGSEVVRVAHAGQWSLVLWGEGRGWAASADVEVP